MYVCWFHNVGTLDDNFLNIAINSIIMALAMYNALIVYPFDMHKSIMWHECTGTSTILEKMDICTELSLALPFAAIPEPETIIMDVQRLTYIPAIFSVLIHVVLYVRISWEKAAKTTAAQVQSGIKTNRTMAFIVSIGTNLAVVILMTSIGVISLVIAIKWADAYNLPKTKTMPYQVSQKSIGYLKTTTFFIF